MCEIQVELKLSIENQIPNPDCDSMNCSHVPQLCKFPLLFGIIMQNTSTPPFTQAVGSCCFFFLHALNWESALVCSASCWKRPEPFQHHGQRHAMQHSACCFLLFFPFHFCWVKKKKFKWEQLRISNKTFFFWSPLMTKKTKHLNKKI